jgi:hypothetical protein
VTVPHPDFAVSVTQRIEVATRAGVAGRVIALGWWVDPAAKDDPRHEPAGTLYLVVDERQPRPVWVPEGELASMRLVD